MGALTENAGLLFHIRADGDQAKQELAVFRKEFKQTESDIKGLGSVANQIFSGFTREMGLSGQQAAQLKNQIGQMAGIFTAAGGAIAATAAIEVAAVAGLASILISAGVAASDYGSKIHDASDQMGVGAQTASALKYAAETSGSSFEKITGSVAKFSTLLGQAENGNKKAEKTLADYGITAKDTNGALEQAVTVIAQMTDSTKQSAAAAALFKDRTGEILPVIKSFGGDLEGLKDHLRDLGLLMSDKDAAAADEFGDKLDTLKLVMGGLERTIGSELLPAFIELEDDLLSFAKNNMAAFKEWAAGLGRDFLDVVHGVEYLGRQSQTFLTYINALLGNNQNSWITWGDVVNKSVRFALGPLGEMLVLLKRIGAATGEGEVPGPYSYEMSPKPSPGP